MQMPSKNILALVLVLLGILMNPVVTNAHDGMREQAGSVAVYLTQTPSTFKVGEAITMDFTVVSSDTDASIANLKFDMQIVEASVRKIVLKQEDLTADSNGVFSVGYTLDRDTDFNVILSFTDPQTSVEEKIIFTLIPEETVSISYLMVVPPLLFVLGVIATVMNIWKINPIYIIFALLIVSMGVGIYYYDTLPLINMAVVTIGLIVSFLVTVGGIWIEKSRPDSNSK